MDGRRLDATGSFCSACPQLRVSHLLDTEILLEASPELTAQLAAASEDGVVAVVEDNAGTVLCSLRREDVGNAVVALMVARGPHWIRLMGEHSPDALVQFRVAATEAVDAAWEMKAA